MSGESLRRQRAAASHRTAALPMTPSPLPPPVFSSPPTAASGLAVHEMPRGPPPMDSPGCHPDRKSVRVALKNGQQVDMVLAESWDEVDLHIEWLLEDAVIADQEPKEQETQQEEEQEQADEQVVESFDAVVNDLPAADAQVATDAQQQDDQVHQDGQEMPPELDADANFANQLNSDEGPEDTDSTSAAGTDADTESTTTTATTATTSTSRPSTAPVATEFTYLLGLDTESYHIRAENRLLPTPTRTLPSTLQLASRTRVLIVPVYFLTHMQRHPLSGAFRALFARKDVQWTGVGVLEDLVPFQASLGVAMHARGVLDVARVTKYWRVPMSLEDLTFQFTDLAGGDVDAGNAAVDVFGGIPHDVPPTHPSPTILRNLRTNASTCAQCSALVADPAAVPDYMYLEESLVGLGTGAHYPDLRIGWKSTQLSMSMWDMPPDQWTATHVVYAGMDAVASRAVGDKIRAVVDPDTWTAYWAAVDTWKAKGERDADVPLGPMPVLAAYRPLPLRLAAKLSETHSPLEAIRRTLAHVAACREAGHPSIRSVLRCIQDWRLLRGVKDRRGVITRAIEHFVRLGVADLVDAQGNSLVGHGGRRDKFTFEAAGLVNDGKVYLGHVCLTREIDPVPPTSGVMGAVPDDLPAFLDANVGRVPGVLVTREQLVECVAWMHPDLAVYNEQPARVLARAWVSGLPESMVNKVVKEARYQTRVVERGMVDGGMGGGVSRKERERDRLSKGQKRIREQQRENARRREEEYLEGERVRLEKIRLEEEELAAAATGDVVNQDTAAVDESDALESVNDQQEQSPDENEAETPAAADDEQKVQDDASAVVAKDNEPVVETETASAEPTPASPTESESDKSVSAGKQPQNGKSSRSSSRSRRSNNNNRTRTSPPAKFDNSKIEAFLHPHPPHHTAPVPPAGSHRMVAAYKAHLSPDAKVAEKVALEWSWNEEKLADADAEAGVEEHAQAQAQAQKAAANVPLPATPQDAYVGSNEGQKDEWDEAEVVNKSLLEATGEADVDLLDQFAMELDLLDAEAGGLGVGGGVGGNQGTKDSGHQEDEWWATADVEDEMDLDAMTTAKPGFAGAIAKPVVVEVQDQQQEREVVRHNPYSLSPPEQMDKDDEPAMSPLIAALQNGKANGNAAGGLVVTPNGMIVSSTPASTAATTRAKSKSPARAPKAEVASTATPSTPAIAPETATAAAAAPAAPKIDLFAKFASLWEAPVEEEEVIVVKKEVVKPSKSKSGATKATSRSRSRALHAQRVQQVQHEQQQQQYQQQQQQQAPPSSWGQDDGWSQPAQQQQQPNSWAADSIDQSDGPNDSAGGTDVQPRAFDWTKPVEWGESEQWESGIVSSTLPSKQALEQAGGWGEDWDAYNGCYRTDRKPLPGAPNERGKGKYRYPGEVDDDEMPGAYKVERRYEQLEDPDFDVEAFARQREANKAGGASPAVGGAPLSYASPTVSARAPSSSRGGSGYMSGDSTKPAAASVFDNVEWEDPPPLLTKKFVDAPIFDKDGLPMGQPKHLTPQLQSKALDRLKRLGIKAQPRGPLVGGAAAAPAPTPVPAPVKPAAAPMKPTPAPMKPTPAPVKPTPPPAVNKPTQHAAAVPPKPVVQPPAGSASSAKTPAPAAVVPKVTPAVRKPSPVRSPTVVASAQQQMQQQQQKPQVKAQVPAPIKPTVKSPIVSSPVTSPRAHQQEFQEQQQQQRGRSTAPRPYVTQPPPQPPAVAPVTPVTRAPVSAMPTSSSWDDVPIVGEIVPVKPKPAAAAAPVTAVNKHNVDGEDMFAQMGSPAGGRIAPPETLWGVVLDSYELDVPNVPKPVYQAPPVSTSNGSKRKGGAARGMRAVDDNNNGRRGGARKGFFKDLPESPEDDDEDDWELPPPTPSSASGPSSSSSGSGRPGSSGSSNNGKPAVGGGVWNKSSSAKGAAFDFQHQPVWTETGKKGDWGANEYARDYTAGPYAFLPGMT